MNKDEMLARRDLNQTAVRLREVGADIGAAHVSATRAKDNGGPDFTERIRTVLAQVEGLCADIEEAARPKRADEPIHGRAGFGG